MLSSDHLKSNGARLSRLLIDKGTEAMRMFFDSIHPPATWTASLNAYRGRLHNLKTRHVITSTQWNILFSSGAASKSNDYDITLLFILLRNTCGLLPPATTGSWNLQPPPIDVSKEADLARIKYYRNSVYGHIISTGVNDANFKSYWNDISAALTRLGVDPGDVAVLKTSPLEEELYLQLMQDWDEKEGKIKKILEEIEKKIKWIIAAVTTLIFLMFVCLLLSIYNSYFPLYPDPNPSPINYSYPLSTSNPGFVGRQWFFRILEDLLNKSPNLPGVQILCDPGLGKSAMMKQLIDSPSSSVFIHQNIVAYHFCKFNEKTTRDGERFVKNLVHFLCQKIPEFKSVIKEVAIQNELNHHCMNDPISCFRIAVLKPLQKINKPGKNNSFILIDALDECLEKEGRHHSVILGILRSCVPYLPQWIKLILTSRREASITGKMSKIGFSTISVNAEDQRNLKDIRSYAEQIMFPNTSTYETASMEEKLHLNHSIDLVLKFAKGNFLFLKTILEYWEKTPHKMDDQSLPPTLGNIYAKSFGERFKEEDFERFEPLLEVLLASNTPPKLNKLDRILNFYSKTYNTRKVVNKLSSYLISDSDEPVQFYHQFFAEWLMNQTEGIDGIFIQKSRGHQLIADYLLDYYNQRQTNLTLVELSELSMHVLFGGIIRDKVSKLRDLSVSEIRDSSKRCILHDLAPKRESTEIISVFIKQFHSVDIFDDQDWTPAFYAATAGNYENLKLFIEYRTDVNHAIKRTFCSYWNFIVPRSFDQTNTSMIFIAAYKGYTKIAKLLVTSGAEINKADDGCGWKPLHVATANGHFKIVELLINNGAKADVITLHHAAARNYSDIVRFLSKTGIRDKCLPCKRENISWCSTSLHQFHHCLCETALHAAVSRGYLSIVEILLRNGNTTLECKHGSGRTPLMDAVQRNNTQIVERLLIEGANIEAECENSTANMFVECGFAAFKEKDWLYSRYCNQPVCFGGNRVIHFCAAHGLWEMAFQFIYKRKASAVSTNSLGWSVTTAAAIYDQADFIYATYGKKTNSIPNIEIMLRYVAVCASVETLKLILKCPFNRSTFAVVYEDGKTLLHFATLGSFYAEPYLTQSCSTTACICPNQTYVKDDNNKDQKRFETIMLLAKVLQPNINEKDKHGRTALHYAAVRALLDAVKHLVRKGSDWNIKDQSGDTPLEFALRESPLRPQPFLSCRMTADQVFRSCQSTIFDETVSYLIMLQNSTISKCDIGTEKLLGYLLRHRLPLSLYALFRFSADINCSHEHFKRYLKEEASNSWSRRRDEIIEVFMIFEVNVIVKCGVPFDQSALHLMAYLGTPAHAGNLFKPSAKNRFFPLQRFINSQAKGSRILDECYDEEGYLAIHRAVQGTNIDAFTWFMELGVDISKKTRSGWTALDLATYYLPSSCTTSFTTSSLCNHRQRIFEKLLEQVKRMEYNGYASFWCKTELVELSPLHVAGSRGMGMLANIHRKIPILLPLICKNNHGIQPLYLAYLYHSVAAYTSWDDKQAFQDLGFSIDGKPSQYPEPEAEYHLIYNQFFQTPQIDFSNELDLEGLFECPGINDLLPHRNMIESQIKRCNIHCRQSASQASNNFLSTFRYIFIENDIFDHLGRGFIDVTVQMAELRCHSVKMFHKISSRLWRQVSKAYSCSHRCRCLEIMQLLQEQLTSKPRENKRVGKFVTERMGWDDISANGNMRHRWPFSFLLKKALKRDKAYEYLKILISHFDSSPLFNGTFIFSPV